MDILSHNHYTSLSQVLNAVATAGSVSAITVESFEYVNESNHNHTMFVISDLLHRQLT